MSQDWLDSATTIIELQQTAALPQESAEVRLAFDDLFGQYDAANQQHRHVRLHHQASPDQLLGQRIPRAGSAGMAEHGPTAEATRDAADLAAMQEMEAIAEEEDAARSQLIVWLPSTVTGRPFDLGVRFLMAHTSTEAIAGEQEVRKGQMDDDLARATGDILFVVEGNASPRFKNSNFLNLMRRIGLREVVVDEKSFVNARTGDEITIVLDEGTSVLFAVIARDAMLGVRNELFGGLVLEWRVVIVRSLATPKLWTQFETMDEPDIAKLVDNLKRSYIKAAHVCCEMELEVIL
ncbi:hypothetical protein QBC38DRAFT_515622 [Podospora fimiseda]|uniref:Uncharacterized protein n=1 Tax=Podospora fimiseda TaxID=252190 RepID=A0AAN7GTC8_9PEZI|nr:hypothetical protein QBC38DRAFT_515622 [Podospora fimiseda]